MRADDYEKPARGRSSVLDLLLPVVVLIVVCIVSLIWSGGYYDGESEYFHDFVGPSPTPPPAWRWPWVALWGCCSRWCTSGCGGHLL